MQLYLKGKSFPVITVYTRITTIKTETHFRIVRPGVIDLLHIMPCPVYV